jgi:hypothetical protein
VKKLDAEIVAICISDGIKIKETDSIASFQDVVDIAFATQFRKAET